MKAMIFAAGLGTRLKPLTDNIPKALIEIGSTTLLEITIKKLIKSGFSPIVVNVHHFAGMVKNFLKSEKFKDLPIIISDESEMLLETGGGLKKAAPFLKGDEPVMIHNVDVLSDLNLLELVDYHINTKGLATLAVRKRKSERYLLFDQDFNLVGWKNEKTGETKIARLDKFYHTTPYSFSGIQIISPELFDLFGEEKKFSIIDTYLMLADRFTIKGFYDSSSTWIDVGKPEQLEEARRLFAQMP